MTDKTLLLVGDSWGYGVWDTTGKIVSTGITEHFQKNKIKIHNLSIPGGSNRDSIQALYRFLEKNTNLGEFIGLMIVTDPIRSLRPYHNLTQKIIECHGLLEAANAVLKEDFCVLNDTCNKHNIKINLIGGLCTCDQELLDHLDCIEVLISSWPKLLVGDLDQFQDIDWKNFGLWGSDWTFNNISINDLMNQNKMDSVFGNLAEKVITQLIQLDQNNRVLKHQYFAPDHAHPGFRAHEILFENIFYKLFP